MATPATHERGCTPTPARDHLGADLPPRAADPWRARPDPLGTDARLEGDVAEREVVDLRRDILGLHEDYVGLAGRLDNLDRRFARIEHRLDLVDESTSPSS